MSKMKKIAITGTIGSGKSTFASMVRDAGYEVFDSDLYGKELLKPEYSAFQEIVSVFGTGILNEDGYIENSRLAGAIFNNPALRNQLNHILHPAIKKGMFEFFRTHEKETFVFAEVPLLFEVGWDIYFDRNVLITCAEPTAVRRLVERRGYTVEEAEQRIRSQMKAAEKIARSDSVIQNDGTLKQFRLKTARWLDMLEKGELWK